MTDGHSPWREIRTAAFVLTPTGGFTQTKRRSHGTSAWFLPSIEPLLSPCIRVLCQDGRWRSLGKSPSFGAPPPPSSGAALARAAGRRWPSNLGRSGNMQPQLRLSLSRAAQQWLTVGSAKATQRLDRGSFGLLFCPVSFLFIFIFYFLI